MGALVIMLAFYVLIVALFAWVALYLIEEFAPPRAGMLRTAVIILAMASVIALVWLVLGSFPKRAV